MKPLDAVIRDRLNPPLKLNGFKQKARVFYREDADGDWAFVTLRESRLGIHDAEFIITLDVQPKIYRDWLHSRGYKTNAGLWSTVLGPSGGQAGGNRDRWGIDLADEHAGEQLTTVVSNALPGFLRYLDTEELLAYALQPTDWIPKVGDIAVPLLLASRGPSAELSNVLDSISDSPDGTPDALVSFIRNWLAESSAADAK